MRVIPGLGSGRQRDNFGCNPSHVMQMINSEAGSRALHHSRNAFRRTREVLLVKKTHNGVNSGIGLEEKRRFRGHFVVVKRKNVVQR